jgi:hypothetical protein
VTLRRLLFLIGGLFAAGVAILLRPGTSYAQTPALPVDPAPVVAQPVTTTTAVAAPVVDVVRTAPIAGPIVGTVGDPAHLEPPDALPIVSALLPPGPPRSAEPSSARRGTTSVDSRAARSTAVPTVSNLPARAVTRTAARPHFTTTISLAPARPDDSTSAVVLSWLRDSASGVAADGQTKLRANASAASIVSVERAVAPGSTRSDVRSSGVPRPGIARDLSPPG